MDAVQADGQGFCHGGLLPGHAVGNLDEHVSGVAVVFRHAAVHMDAQHLQVGAAVGTADAAGIAVPAVQVGVHHHAVAHLDAVLVVGGDGLYDTGQLMADDTGVADQAVGATEGADVAAADTGGDDLDQGLARFGGGLFQFYAGNFPGLCQFDCFHTCITTFLFTHNSIPRVQGLRA